MFFREIPVIGLTVSISATQQGSFPYGQQDGYVYRCGRLSGDHDALFLNPDSNQHGCELFHGIRIDPVIDTPQKS